MVNNSTVTVVGNIQNFLVCFLNDNFEVADEAYVFQKG